MKLISLAALALIGSVTAEEMQAVSIAERMSQIKMKNLSFVQLKKESDEIANADAADDKEIEDEDDPEDDIVDDNGFAHQWV